ncbi:MAG TPA: ParB/RepB/Spo0J family partition protein [Sedimentisphaerales bacterium]|nr:ParB/RepB/Spo0J family partition protein [Sedimentisphaerales bacterium]
MIAELRSRQLPVFLADRYQFHDYRVISMHRLYVGLLPTSGHKPTYVSVIRTPHYAFARQVLTGEAAAPVAGYDDYQQYASRHRRTSSPRAFEDLIASIRTNGYDAEEHPILVFRFWRRPWPLTRWDVADGFHRLAVLAAMGETKVRVATLKPRRSAWQRFIARWSNP